MAARGETLLPGDGIGHGGRRKQLTDQEQLEHHRRRRRAAYQRAKAEGRPRRAAIRPAVDLVRCSKCGMAMFERELSYRCPEGGTHARA